MNSPIHPVTSPRALSWNAALAASPGRLDLDISKAQIEGLVPPALRGGRMLSNGPGWTRIGDWTAHPFDGHGYLRAFEFADDGGCRLRARFIETEVYRREATAERFVHRGFATNLPGPSWRNIGLPPARNVANTTITRWGDRLVAGWEGGAPHALDGETLETRGLETFGGAIAGQTTLAHMRHDFGDSSSGERLILCSVAGRGPTTLTFRELDGEDRLLSTRAAAIPGMMFAHDFAFTPNHYVVGGNPLRLQPKELAKSLVGRSTMLRSVATDSGQAGVLHLIPRRGQGPVRTVRLPRSAFVIHFGNAFERDGAVIVDACAFEDFEFGCEFGYAGPQKPFDPGLPDARPPQRLLRFTVAPGASEATCEVLATHAVDFPRFHPEHEGRETPALFGATRADTRHGDPFDSLIALDLLDPERPPQLWTAPDDVFVGEPIFVPDPARADDGHVLAITSDGLRERSTLAIFEARALAQGPVAAVPLPLLPIAFHGDWDARGRS